MALFIAGLAFPGHPELLDEAKFGIIAGSLASGVVGSLLLALTRPLDAARRWRTRPGGQPLFRGGA